jgi:hypothetical protein
MALSIEERDITQRLKRRIISLAKLERTRKRQASIITNLKEGGANTRFFYLQVNARRWKKPHSSFLVQQWVGYRPRPKGNHHP